PYYGGHGRSDMLTSTYLDLDAFSPTDDVYFSFWIQPEGFGDRPEEIDSLVLEFRDVNGEWIRQMKFDGITNGTPSTEKMPFSFHSIHLDNPNFLYNGFQFRFTNYSTNTGAIDLWHLDYIAINDNRSPSESFNDLAFTRVPDPIIKEYSSIPWKHFLAAPDILRDSFTVEMYNHFDKSVIAVSSNYFPSERVTNTFPLTSFQPLLDPGQDNIDAQTQLQLTNDIDNFSSFQSNMINNYIGEDSLIFRIDYSFDQDDEEREALLNNVVSRTTVFDNYFSYDDGSAETNIIAQNTGTEIGVEFMAYTEDTIRAVAISFIQVDGLDLTKELFNLKVYIDTLDQDPDFENILLKPFLANTVFDTLQGFSTYVLTDQITEDPIAVAVPANTRFYIGLQSASTNEIPIGFDRNSLDGASKNFVALSTGWFPFPTTHQGAVMIRPILGDTFPQSTNTVSIATPDPLTDIIQVYPNPTKGILNFISEAVPFFDLQYDAFNIMGQNIKSGYLQNELDFSELVDGIYFLKIRNRKTDELYHHKFMLLR
ncbi:MAG: T9SS type A sorting domain-containing protein, partial [Bacteroidia bacterium]|nr:T9SS type A sorting domain-containing protein [Bacteroidia bacterium]